MSKRGYEFEHETEQFFLDLEGSVREDLVTDRSFRVPNSGAMTGLKGDIRTSEKKMPWLPKQLLIECKARKNSSKKERSLRVEKIWLDKNKEEAEKEGRLSIVMISFKKSNMNRIHAIIPLDHLKEILLWLKPDPHVTVITELKPKDA